MYHVKKCLPFELQTDASDRGIGGVLLQEGRIVGVYSCKLQGAQEKYTVIEKEALAIVKSLKHFRGIVYGSKVTILTDHSNLQFLDESKLQRVQR